MNILFVIRKITGDDIDVALLDMVAEFEVKKKVKEDVNTNEKKTQPRPEFIITLLNSK